MLSRGGYQSREYSDRSSSSVAGADLDGPDLETRSEKETGRVVIRAIRVATAGERGRKTEIKTEIETERRSQVASLTESDGTRMVEYMK